MHLISFLPNAAPSCKIYAGIERITQEKNKQQQIIVCR